MRDVVHFAHGNGFPSPCYKQLLTGLQAKFDCCYIDKIGHDSRFPVTDNWHTLVDEIILSVKTQSSQPVIGVGHSLGGVLSLLAAIQEPALFKAVILLDSPLLGRVKSSLVHFSKMVGMIDHITPAYRTRGRRVHWDTREEVLSYLRHKKLFQYFTERCLGDYIDYGLQHDEAGYSLRFNPEIEYQIYRTIPHFLHKNEKKLIVPSALIYGDKSTVIDKMDLHHMKTHYGIVNFETKGTHMFPMEYPEEIAELTIRVINKLDLNRETAMPSLDYE